MKITVDTAPEERTHLARQLTKILADLDILFSFFKDTEGEPFWDIVPIRDDSDESPTQEPVRVLLALRQGFLHTFSLVEPRGEIRVKTALALLDLNTRLVIAKVGTEGRSEGAPLLWVGAHLPESAMDAESVKIQIGAVAGAVRQVRKVVSLSESTS